MHLAFEEPLLPDKKKLILYNKLTPSGSGQVAHKSLLIAKSLVLFDTLLAQAQQGDIKATMAVVQIRKNPDDMQNILDKFFTAEEPEIPVAEQELLGGGSLPPQGPPPGIAQLLQGMGG